MENQEGENAVLKPTKTGNGYKIRLPNGSWLYASKGAVRDLVNGRRNGCTFQPIHGEAQNAAAAN